MELTGAIAATRSVNAGLDTTQQIRYANVLSVTQRDH